VFKGEDPTKTPIFKGQIQLNQKDLMNFGNKLSVINDTESISDSLLGLNKKVDALNNEIYSSVDIGQDFVESPNQRPADKPSHQQEESNPKDNSQINRSSSDSNLQATKNEKKTSTQLAQKEPTPLEESKSEKSEDDDDDDDDDGEFELNRQKSAPTDSAYLRQMMFKLKPNESEKNKTKKKKTNKAKDQKEREDFDKMNQSQTSHQSMSSHKTAALSRKI